MLNEPIHLKGVKIVDSKFMKQSRLHRYTIELTENDTKEFAGVLALFQPHELICNLTITPQGSEGESNGYETIHVPFDEDEHRI